MPAFAGMTNFDRLNARDFNSRDIKSDIRRLLSADVSRDCFGRTETENY
jgi:hypothetical protein